MFDIEHFIVDIYCTFPAFELLLDSETRCWEAMKLKKERHAQILELLENRIVCTSKELSEELNFDYTII